MVSAHQVSWAMQVVPLVVAVMAAAVGRHSDAGSAEQRLPLRLPAWERERERRSHEEQERRELAVAAAEKQQRNLCHDTGS
jgi:hypothetical protein